MSCVLPRNLKHGESTADRRGHPGVHGTGTWNHHRSVQNYIGHKRWSVDVPDPSVRFPEIPDNAASSAAADAFTLRHLHVVLNTTVNAGSI